MAKSSSSDSLLERTYTVPLRREFLKVPRWRKTKKAVSALRSFIAKHMKTEDVKLSRSLNEELWKHGIKNPPHKVKVQVSRKDGVAQVRLFGEADAKASPKTAKAPAKKEKSAEELADAKEKKKEARSKSVPSSA